MNWNDGIKMTRLRASTIIGFLAAFLILTLAGYENALVEAAKAF